MENHLEASNALFDDEVNRLLKEVVYAKSLRPFAEGRPLHEQLQPLIRDLRDYLPDSVAANRVANALYELQAAVYPLDAALRKDS